MGSRRICRSAVGRCALESPLDQTHGAICRQTHGQHSWRMSGLERNARGVSIFRSNQQRQTTLEMGNGVGPAHRAHRSTDATTAWAKACCSKVADAGTCRLARGRTSLRGVACHAARGALSPVTLFDLLGQGVFLFMRCAFAFRCFIHRNRFDLQVFVTSRRLPRRLPRRLSRRLRPGCDRRCRTVAPLRPR